MDHQISWDTTRAQIVAKVHNKVQVRASQDAGLVLRRSVIHEQAPTSQLLDRGYESLTLGGSLQELLCGDEHFLEDRRRWFGWHQTTISPRGTGCLGKAQ